MIVLLDERLERSYLASKSATIAIDERCAAHSS